MRGLTWRGTVRAGTVLAALTIAGAGIGIAHAGTSRDNYSTVLLAESGFTYDHGFYTGLDSPTYRDLSFVNQATHTWRTGVDGCDRHTVRVHLTPGDPATYRIVGWLCPARRGDRSAHTVYVIDRLGTGRSDHPDPTLTTFPNQAYATRQVVDALHAGKVDHTRYRDVIGVGHSMGAAIMIEAAAGGYHGFAGVILIGDLHTTDVLGRQKFIDAWEPVAGDPQWSPAGLPVGYLTTKPGARAAFYYASGVAAGVMARDEATKSTGTTGETTTLFAAADPTYSKSITAPVLVVTGAEDLRQCNEQMPGESCATVAAVVQREQPFFTVPVSVVIQPDAGHDTMLHRTGPVGDAQILRWADRVSR